MHPTMVHSKCRAKADFVLRSSSYIYVSSEAQKITFFSLSFNKTMMSPPSFPHPPEPMLLMMGIIMLTAFVATLIRDEEEWQR